MRGRGLLKSGGVGLLGSFGEDDMVVVVVVLLVLLVEVVALVVVQLGEERLSVVDEADAT